MEIFFTVAGIYIFLSASQSPKTAFSIVLRPSGRITLSSEEQPVKTFDFNVVRPSGSDRDLRLVQSLNAALPMSVMLLPSASFVMLRQSSKAYAPMEV